MWSVLENTVSENQTHEYTQHERVNFSAGDKEFSFDMQNVFFFQWSHERLKPIGLEVNILLKRAVTVHNLGALSPMTSHGSNFGAAWDCLVSPDWELRAR